MDGEGANTSDDYLQMVILSLNLQKFLCTHLILQNILGKLLADHPDKIAGDRMFALENVKTSLCAPSSLALYGVDALHALALPKCAAMQLLFPCHHTRVSYNLASNLIVATRCAQVTDLLAAAWAQHSDENPLVMIQLDIVIAYPSADRQARFDLLAAEGGLPRRTTMGMFKWDDIPCPSSLYQYWSYFESMQGRGFHFAFQ